MIFFYNIKALQNKMTSAIFKTSRISTFTMEMKRKYNELDYKGWSCMGNILLYSFSVKSAQFPAIWFVK